jgi:ABC-2 type transport system ATP-binding protein
VAVAIDVGQLKKTFKGGVTALDGVSFSVEEGTVFGLLGPNGAGKTTVVRVLTTVLQPDSGSASVLGIDVLKDPERVRTLFGLAGQYAAVDENLTGAENLKMVGRLNGMSRADVRPRATELLADFGLADAADRTLKTYSGGMRRRLDLAAALVARPRVLFLDEPTTGLDPQSRNDLWVVIEHLVAEGTTVLLTTQYLEEADRLASRIAVVDHGQVISQGTPAELKANLGTTVLEIGLDSEARANEAAGPLQALGGHGIHVIGPTLEVTFDGGARVVMEALRILDQNHIEPSRIALREPSLDDVFLSLTGRQASVASPEGEEPAVAGRRKGRR